MLFEDEQKSLVETVLLLEKHLLCHQSRRQLNTKSFVKTVSNGLHFSNLSKYFVFICKDGLDTPCLTYHVYINP